MVICILLNATDRSISYLINKSKLVKIFKDIEIENDYKLAVSLPSDAMQLCIHSF